MPGKPNSLRTNISKKEMYNIRGIGHIFNWFPSTLRSGMAKPLNKVLREPTVNMLSLDVLKVIVMLRNISYWKDRRWI